MTADDDTNGADSSFEDSGTSVEYWPAVSASRSVRNTNHTVFHQLYCRTGYHLQLHADGTVNGTRIDHSQQGVLQIVTAAIGLVSVLGVDSNLFLCMNRKGRLFGMKEKSNECVFQEKISENWYNTYASYKYSLQRLKWYVALNKRGKPRRGDRARRKQKFTHFLVRPVDVKKLENLYGNEYLNRVYYSALQRTSSSSSKFYLRR